MMKSLTLLLAFLVGSFPVNAQSNSSALSSQQEPIAPVQATSADDRLAGYEARKALIDQSLVANVPFRNVGPTVMSGRVVDVDVNPADPTHFYVAYASGGLWKTTNNGLTFESLFDDQAVMTQGDIAVDWSHGEIIWMGTGENNASRSSYAGAGIYKSLDGGATWQHLGLAETHRTGRIVLHPEDPNTVWVAASGHLYSPNGERGIYKTTDGGETWQQTLFVDDNTGAIDLVINPDDPSILYAAMWHRERRAWNFVESGGGSGIYKSDDGGDTWTLITSEGSGFPTGEGVGRIGLALYPGNPNVLYALLDNQERRAEEEEEEQPALTRDMLREMTREAFIEQVEAEDLESYLRDNGFPPEHTAESITERIDSGDLEPISLVYYLEDANRELFDTPVIGLEVYRSDDAGKSWSRTHEEDVGGVYFSYGYYFGQIRVAPDTAERIYIMGVPILKSEDGGKTFTSINEENVHVDHHALWVSGTRPGHIINGNDGGINISWDDGKSWFKANSPSVGQFYAIQVDEAMPYNVYGGLQDNGVWVGPNTYEHNFRWHGSGSYPYESLMGGDGMQIEVDTRTNDIVYTGFQFGNYFRIDRSSGQRTGIKPRHELGERPLRFNWQSPIHLSRHNQDILYYGSNKLHRSFNRGDDWETLSDDLTKGGIKGDVPFGTLATIDESPLRFGLLYVGSDDGYVHMSNDAGNTWDRISDDLPQDLWVSRVEASHHAEGRVYVTLNGYRWDNFEAYVYRSDDYGVTWTHIGEDLPLEPVNVIVEDPAVEDVLYVGTDHGLYVSLDQGASFMAFEGGLPYTPVHDLKVQAREKDLVVGTHGRSIFIADMSHVQQLTPELVAEALHIFDIEEVRFSSNWGIKRASWSEPNVPEVTLPFFSGASGETTIQIKSEDDLILKSLTVSADRGLNYIAYDLTVDPAAAEDFNEAQEEKDEDDRQLMEEKDNGVNYLIPGSYSVEISQGNETVTGQLMIKDRSQRGGSGEPRMGPSDEEEIK